MDTAGSLFQFWHGGSLKSGQAALHHASSLGVEDGPAGKESRSRRLASNLSGPKPIRW
jgi:hypothetical protein